MEVPAVRRRASLSLRHDREAADTDDGTRPRPDEQAGIDEFC